MKITLCDSCGHMFQARDLLEILFQKDAVTLAGGAREVLTFSARFSSQGRKLN